jgi:hypothetical protein
MRVNQLKPVSLAEDSAAWRKLVRAPVGNIRFTSREQQLNLTLQKPAAVFIRKEKDQGDLQVFIPVVSGNVEKGQTATRNFSLKVSGLIDRKQVTLVLDTTDPGRVFDGIGGNFRLQNPKEDPKVIDYCLKHLRVAWGRVEMPWSLWQPEMDEDPVAAAKAGKLNPHVAASMEMAARLYKKGIPVILSAWFPPAWAVTGKLRSGPGPDGVWGNPLNQTRTKEIYRSIAGYIAYLKAQYGVEIADFSFNESDLGINVRQTGAEQDALIKGLGAYFVSKGLNTKLLLGDNSDATTYGFINPALHDPAARPYIGAVSFHSWRGWDKETLQKWADAATTLHLPLIVAEGSIDAQAWGYPEIFEEPSYALKEINLYVKLLAICQPKSILQWQLTSDYSLLAGGGIYGNNSPLHPTQRFWNLKQLASTPAGLRAMSLEVQGANISGAALGDNHKGVYAIHLVNNGASRQMTLTGLPATVKSLRVWVTDKDKSMQEGHIIAVKKGKATFTLDATSFTTLISKRN